MYLCEYKNLTNFDLFSFLGLASSLGSYFLILSKSVTSSPLFSLPIVFSSNPHSDGLRHNPHDLISLNFFTLIKKAFSDSL